jgi:hypothetical protein
VLSFTAQGLVDYQGTYEEYLETHKMKEFVGAGRR